MILIRTCLKTEGGSEPHEQTFSFRIALYLQNLLRKEESLFIDCEYHGAYGEKETEKRWEILLRQVIGFDPILYTMIGKKRIYFVLK